jgi:SAM-dependent methyltransferase
VTRQRPRQDGDGRHPTCPTCAGTGTTWHASVRDVEYRTSDRTWEYFACPRCETLFLEEPPVEQLAVIYPPNYYSYGMDKAGVAERVKAALDRRFFRRLLRGVAGEGLAVLDVGGGAGQQVGLLRDLDPRVSRTVVVDIDEGAAQGARSAGHEFVLSRIEDFEPRGETFDVVLLFNVIEHVARPQEVLDRVRTMLSARGVAVIQTPNVDALDARLLRHRNWGGYHCPRHWVLFTAEGFGRLARSAGLRADHTRFTQGAPFWAVGVLGWMADHRLARIDAARPLPNHPLYGPLVGVFAGFDFVRHALGFRTSQIVVLVRRDDGPDQGNERSTSIAAIEQHADG